MSVIEKDIKTATAAKPSVKIINERCAGCQECIIRCPTQALTMDVVSWVATANDDLCVGCRQCIRTCPFSAINVDGPMLTTERVRPKEYLGSVALGDMKEVRAGLTKAEAMAEAKRCLNCPDPTCVRGCPTHNDIPAFIEAIRNGNLEQAHKVLSQTTCMPDVCSRVCDQSKQCEGACSWSLAGGQPVAIGKLERYVADNSPVPPLRRSSERGKGLSVGILGSGPAGIAAAWELASAGASVTIYDRDQEAGGVMWWGIPAYVLPDTVRERPIKALAAAGVDVRLNTKVSPDQLNQLLEKHDAVIAAYGAPVPERPHIPGVDLDGVVDATAFLKKAKHAFGNGLMPELRGTRVLVLGGSNTAIDVARTVVRLGGKATIIHRREERYTRGRLDEIAEAKAEGVEFRFSTNVVRLEGEAGKLKRAVLVRTRQSGPNSTPANVEVSEQTVDADLMVLATGYSLEKEFTPVFGKLPIRQPRSEVLLPDRRWLGSGLLSGKSAAGRLAWEREYGLRAALAPRRERLWLIGDALIGPATVVAAMAQGRMAARSVLESQSRKQQAKKTGQSKAA